MGFAEPAFQESEEEMIAGALHNPANLFLNGINYQNLKGKKYLKANVKPLLPGKLKTPSGKIELYSKRMAKHGYSPLPTYIPLKLEEKLPFIFVAAPNHNFLNSTFSNIGKHQVLEKEPLLYMNQKDASKRGIVEGERVTVWNHRGKCELKVSLGENVLPGVVVTQGLWENRDDRNQLVNTLTPDRLADMGGGAVFFSGRVNISGLQK